MIEDKKAWTTLTVIHAHLFSYLIYSTLNPQLHSRSATYKRGMDF